MRSPQRWFRDGLIALGAALVLGLTGCADAPAPGTSDPVPGSTSAGALGFTATTLDGSTLDTATLAGKPTVLWFWAPS